MCVLLEVWGCAETHCTCRYGIGREIKLSEYGCQERGDKDDVTV